MEMHVKTIPGAAKCCTSLVCHQDAAVLVIGYLTQLNTSGVDAYHFKVSLLAIHQLLYPSERLTRLAATHTESI